MDMKKWLREHGLLLVNVSLFVVFLLAMAVTGWHVANNETVLHGGEPESLGAYLLSGDFYEAVFENWESEFLQMGAYVVLTVFLFQKGSSESKPLDEPAPQDEHPRRVVANRWTPWPVRKGGWVLAVYEHSLAI